MVQPHGMVLEGRVAVGHGGVPGVPGFGEEAEIGQAQAADEGQAGLAALGRRALLGPGMEEHGAKQQRQEGEAGQAERRWTHEGAEEEVLHSIAVTAGPP